MSDNRAGWAVVIVTMLLLFWLYNSGRLRVIAQALSRAAHQPAQVPTGSFVQPKPSGGGGGFFGTLSKIFGDAAKAYVATQTGGGGG